VKDGGLRQRGYQVRVQKRVLWRFSYGFAVTVYQHWQPKFRDQFTETDIQ
jgi:hypothetical protein